MGVRHSRTLKQTAKEPTSLSVEASACGCASALDLKACSSATISYTSYFFQATTTTQYGTRDCPLSGISRLLHLHTILFNLITRSIALARLLGVEHTQS